MRSSTLGIRFALLGGLVACSGSPPSTTAGARAGDAVVEDEGNRPREFVNCRMALRIQQDACRKDRDVPRKTDAEMAAFCKSHGHEPAGRTVVAAILAHKDASCTEMGKAVVAAVRALEAGGAP